MRVTLQANVQPCATQVRSTSRMSKPIIEMPGWPGALGDHRHGATIVSAPRR
jgi:hypothetical protein